MSKLFGVALFATALVGCGTQAPETAQTEESLRRTNCALVLCALPVCGPGQVLRVPPGQCCPQCVSNKSTKIQAGDCACSGGYMDEKYCGEFGAPWTWRNGSCTWDARAQGGLTAETCEAIEAKHAGDGTGSDIYNLGLSCEFGESDCRSKGCPSGQHCDVCKTRDGTGAYVCLPDGAVC